MGRPIFSLKTKYIRGEHISPKVGLKINFANFVICVAVFFLFVRFWLVLFFKKILET